MDLKLLPGIICCQLQIKLLIEKLPTSYVEKGHPAGVALIRCMIGL
jgi:hypothetical protein